MKLKDALKGKLSPEELELLVRSYDVVGDIAIIIIPPELETKESLIGETLLHINKNVNVVAKRDGSYQGEYRTIPLKIIAGENRKETEYKEHGVRFFLNPETVYFSVRLSNERKRLAQLVRPGEHILILFSGIGVFPLVLSKISPADHITGVEKNGAAHKYATKNLASNKRLRNVTLLEGDVMDVLPTLGQKYDRVAMPLPKTGEMYLDIALSCLKQGGWLHFYEFQKMDHFDESIEKVQEACQRNNRRFLYGETVVCGHSGPTTYRICVDAKIR
jgi:tRNA (guanine37-N1)-methyltransferase